MSITLGTPRSPGWRGYPPHMSDEDFKIWVKYRSQIEPLALRLYFDVGVGGTSDYPPDTPDYLKKDWLRLTQKRIDVLAETADSWIIIELRARATSSVLGRLMVYGKLWRDEQPDGKRVRLIAVSDTRDKDVVATADTMDIEFVVVD